MIYVRASTAICRLNSPMHYSHCYCAWCLDFFFVRCSLATYQHCAVAVARCRTRHCSLRLLLFTFFRNEFQYFSADYCHWQACCAPGNYHALYKPKRFQSFRRRLVELSTRKLLYRIIVCKTIITINFRKVAEHLYALGSYDVALTEGSEVRGVRPC